MHVWKFGERGNWEIMGQRPRKQMEAIWVLFTRFVLLEFICTSPFSSSWISRLQILINCQSLQHASSQDGMSFNWRLKQEEWRKDKISKVKYLHQESECHMTKNENRWTALLCSKQKAPGLDYPCEKYETIKAIGAKPTSPPDDLGETWEANRLRIRNQVLEE